MDMTTLAFAGDVMLGRLVSDAIKQMPPERPWGDVLPIMAAADVRIVNLECAITTHTKPWTRTEKVFHFGADPVAIKVLSAARIDAVSLANNHVLDFNETGLFDTLQHLDQAGIAHAGAGRNLDEAKRPAMLEADGVRIALIALTDNEPAFAASATQPGTYYQPVSTAPATLAQIKGTVQAARAAGADIVVLSNHWGPNMVQHPPPYFCEFAQAMIELGVDVYFGHSAHLFQGVEIYGGKPILYDTGDFIDDYAIDPWLRNDWSFLFVLTLEAGRLERLELWPVTLSQVAEVRLAQQPDRTQLCRRMRSLSEAFGTHLSDSGGRLLWEADAA
jgi:poly-gamma-glutamate synthesis protein (capsule biosynthesis protein)